MLAGGSYGSDVFFKIDESYRGLVEEKTVMSTWQTLARKREKQEQSQATESIAFSLHTGSPYSSEMRSFMSFHGNS